MNNKFFATTMLAMAVLAAPAFAQDSPLLPGGVQYDANTDESSSLRIARPQHAATQTGTIMRRAPLTSGVSSSDFQTKLLPQRPQMAPVPAQPAPGTLQGAIQAIRDFAPYLHSTATQSSSPPAPPSVQVGAPYVWYQSALGGYWDASGTTHDVVRADRLYLYGGKFADGTIVPKEPIHDMNAMGHAFRQGELPTQAFWSH